MASTAGHVGPSVLGIDVGSTNIKVALVALDADGGAVGPVAVRAIPTPDDADALVDAVRTAVGAVLAGRTAPAAVGIASMAETGVPLDAGGRPLTGLLRWDGSRGTADAARLAADLGAAELFAATGVRPSAKVPLVTWLWLQRTHPDVWRRVTRWAGVADLVGHALTGRLATDHTLAGRTMAYRLPPAGQPLPRSWVSELLDVVGWTADHLPDVVPPGAVAGTVSATSFVRAGLTAGTPVVIAGHDHAVGAWAAGVRAPGDRGDSVGTAEAVLTVVGGHVDRARVAGQGMSLVRTVAGDHEALLAGSPAAGAMVRWWSDTVLGDRPLAGVLPGEAPEEPTGLLVLPYPRGRQAPAPDPSARVRALDATGRDVTDAVLVARRPADGSTDPRPDVARWTVALFEGLAHHARWMLDAQAGLAGVVPSEAGPPVRVLAGSAAANTVWMGLKAAVGAGPVALVTAAEPVATGAALLAAQRAGVAPPGAVPLPARTRTASPAAAEAHAALHPRFLAAATAPPAAPAHPPAGRPATGHGRGAGAVADDVRTAHPAPPGAP